MTTAITAETTAIESGDANLRNFVDLFIQSQDVKESSKILYRRTLKQFFRWLRDACLQLRDVSRPTVLEYKETLLKRGLSSLTVSSYITSVRRFFEFAEANKVFPNVAKGIKSPKRKQQFRKMPLQPEQAKKLIEYGKTNLSKRDYAIINLLLRTGLRTIEVIRANVGDITFKGTQRVLMVQGKGRDEKDNFVVLTDKAFKPIAEYLNGRRCKDNDPLFISESNNNYGERLTTRTISYIAKQGLKSIGIDDRHFTAHSLRHTTAVNILRAGGSLETAQFTLRHSNPATTQIYTSTLNEERRLAHSGEALIDTLY